MQMQADGRRAEKAAQYAASNKELEERVAVLERIVTDRGYDVATQIEALRDQRRVEERLEARRNRGEDLMGPGETIALVAIVGGLIAVTILVGTIFKRIMPTRRSSSADRRPHGGEGRAARRRRLALNARCAASAAATASDARLKAATTLSPSPCSTGTTP